MFKIRDGADRRGQGKLDSHKDAGVKWVHFFCGLYRARLICSRIRIWPWPERSGSWPKRERGEESWRSEKGGCTGLNTLECISISWLWLHCRQTSASAALSGGYAPTCQIKEEKREKKKRRPRHLGSNSAGCLCNSVHRSLRCINHTQCGLL